MHTCLIKNIAATKCQITYKVKYLHIKGWQTDKKSIVFINVMTIVEFHVETGEIRQIFASKLTSPKDVLISARPFDGEDCQKVVIFSLRCLKSTLFSWYFLINIEYWTRQISLSVFIANMCPIFDGPQSINLTRYQKIVCSFGSKNLLNFTCLSMKSYNSHHTSVHAPILCPKNIFSQHIF